jgi:FkbM family methyltransferase
MFYRVVDSVRAFLKAELRKGSIAWRVVARVARRILLTYHRNPLSRRRWSANANAFARAIAAEERNSSEFWFIQVGACDGFIDDPIHEDIKTKGWRGILIEPQSAEFQRLKDTYRLHADRLIFENVAIADSDGERMLYKVKESRVNAQWQRGIASFLPISGVDDMTMIETERVRCITFEALLAKHRLPQVSLLQVDVEGYDFEILKLAKLDIFKPRLIRYEHCHLGFQGAAECRKYLQRNGYVVLPMEWDTGAILSA